MIWPPLLLPWRRPSRRSGRCDFLEWEAKLVGDFLLCAWLGSQTDSRLLCPLWLCCFRWFLLQIEIPWDETDSSPSVHPTIWGEYLYIFFPGILLCKSKSPPGWLHLSFVDSELHLHLPRETGKVDNPKLYDRMNFQGSYSSLARGCPWDLVTS